MQEHPLDNLDRFASDRHFFVAGYMASHGQLLFRSPKDGDGAKTRIDVLIKDVRALELRVWTDGLTIEEVDKENVADASTWPIPLIERGNRVYRLKGAGWEGYVVGGALFAAEDENELGAPSPFSESFSIGIGIR